MPDQKEKKNLVVSEVGKSGLVRLLAYWLATSEGRTLAFLQIGIRNWNDQPYVEVMRLDKWTAHTSDISQLQAKTG